MTATHLLSPFRPAPLLRLLLGLGLLCLALLARAAPNLYDLPFRFLNERGATVTLGDWRGRPAILAMEYSTCRFLCSITLQRLKDAQAEMDRSGRQMDIVVVSIDPKNDTPEAWIEYRRQRKLERDNWHFLVGSEGDTKLLARMLDISYWYYHEHLMHDFKLVRINADGSVGPVIDTYDTDVDVLLQP